MINLEWRWVREKCDKVFESCYLQLTGGGNALLFLNKEEEVSKLLSMPHLSSWNGVYMFSKWAPQMGSLSVRPGEKCDVTIAFGGIPYHLRVKTYFLIWVEVVEEKLESLAKRLPTRAKATGESVKGERPVVTLWEEDARDPWKEGGERSQASTCPPGNRGGDDSPSVEVNQRPKEIEGSNINHGTFKEKDLEVSKPFFKPVSSPKQRGRSRGKEHYRNIPISLNKHVWRNFNERRWSKENSRDSSLVRAHKLFLQGGDVNPIEVEGNQTQVASQVRETINSSEPAIQEDGASSKVEGTQENKVVDRERLGTIANSLYNCKTTDDYSNWIRWIVIPAAGELGVTYSKSIESQVKLYEIYAVRDAFISML
ncbi:hypothetical protein FRX31_022518 [Thalictrum thalictroides]|uniref:DUF4283 domain-containing protein n=1 Tax=Thalictrum thalictroides TaxID=46969 RepID=A0A7J6VT41_THATH|nr:hypothetical protein FRX31_022518 [Thalictrum thalictroides]